MALCIVKLHREAALWGNKRENLCKEKVALAPITEGIYTHIHHGIIGAGALQCTPTVHSVSQRETVINIRELTLTHTCMH